MNIATHYLKFIDYSTTELKALIDWAKDEYRNTLS
jgi:hypothetical protein